MLIIYIQHIIIKTVMKKLKTSKKKNTKNTARPTKLKFWQKMLFLQRKQKMHPGVPNTCNNYALLMACCRLCQTTHIYVLFA